MTTPRRWKNAFAKLREARSSGRLGIIAARTKIPEHRLHDAAKADSFERNPLTQGEMRRLYDYFKG